jgi:hypothetical protein
MIKKLSAFSLIFLTIFTTQAKNNFPQPGFICVPVADLLAEKINSYKLANSTTQAYNTIPLSWGPAEKNRRFFPRVHQALLHETVTVLAQDNDECLIEIHNAFSLPEGKRTPQATYWTHKKNIRLFSQLPDTSQATELLPSAVSFKNNVIDNTYVATLKMPFFDSAMQQAYSAGTRFKIATRRSTQVTVNVYNISSGKFTTLNLPRNLCHIEKYAQGFLSHTASVNEFIALLRRWTHLPEGFIPLVWGGCSFKDLRTYEHAES